MNIWLIIFISFAVILNSIVSIKVIKRDELDSFQKKSQIIMIWLIPLIASIGIWCFIKSEDKDVSKSNVFDRSRSNTQINNRETMGSE